MDPKRTNEPYPLPKSNKACSNCRASKVACEKNKRPCTRCVKAGIAESCVDVPRKKKSFKSHSGDSGSSSHNDNTVHNVNTPTPPIYNSISTEEPYRPPALTFVPQTSDIPISITPNTTVQTTTTTTTASNDNNNSNILTNMNILESDPLSEFGGDFGDMTFSPSMNSLLFSSSDQISATTPSPLSTPLIPMSEINTPQTTQTTQTTQMPHTPQMAPVSHMQQMQQMQLPQMSQIPHVQPIQQMQQFYPSMQPQPLPPFPPYVQHLNIPLKVSRPIPAPGSFVDPNSLAPAQHQEMLMALRSIRSQQQELLNNIPNYHLSQPIYSQLGWAKFSTSTLHLLDCNDAFAFALGCRSRSHLLYGMGIIFWKQLLHPELHMIATKTAYDALANGIDKINRPCVFKKLDGLWTIIISNIVLHPQVFFVDFLNIEVEGCPENEIRGYFVKRNM
eukprot:TRINITY_DN1379_c0_g1_i1.p1 TRINITY_DN1379_c0_g1~~TRINITY_DN1379_c0_g1_i1.p1  ORF type:complete len:447 (-),score=78.12 TRINITY_DN1379_c0_g1_i1:84-1424(-)